MLIEYIVYLYIMLYNLWIFIVHLFHYVPNFYNSLNIDFFVVSYWLLMNLGPLPLPLSHVVRLLTFVYLILTPLHNNMYVKL